MINEGLNLILISLLRTMAMVYDFMVNLASGTSVSNFADPIKDIVGILYTLAGVFMLFRITISFINMLIDPDKINDKNGGPSKILTNVIVTILLLILFQPSGLVYKELSRFEKAMIGNGQNGGFIGRLISVDGSEQFSSQKNKNSEEDYEIKVPFIENVSAAENLTCYFVKSTTTGAPSNAHGIVKLTFYSNKASSSTEIIGANDKYNAYVVSSAGSTEKLSTGQTVTFKNYYGNGTYMVPKVGAPGSFDAFIDGFPKSCSSIKLRMASGADLLANNTSAYITSDNYFQNSKSWLGDSSVGYGNLDTAVEHYLNLLDKKNINVKNDSVDASITDIENLQDEFKKAGGTQTGPQIFANAVAQSFYTCNSAGDFKNIFGPVNSTISEEDEKDCSLKAKNIVNQKSSDIVSLIDKEVMNADFIIGIILTIGFIVFLGILCVDVIIRNFKLVLLQMIAPIPIICGIDPKDKMRGQWFKMYFSTYAILFVYLFAIKLVSVLLVVDIKQYMPKTNIFQSAIVEIFYLIALLVFAKMIPSIISKVFGISADASSFKQIGGMLKGAALGTAGAVLAGTTAAGFGLKNTASAFKAQEGSTGKKLMSALGTLGSGTVATAGAIAVGAGASKKGNVMAGVRNVVARDAELQHQKAMGITAGDRLMMAVARNTGIELGGPGKKSLEQIKYAQDVTSKRDALDSWAGAELKKKGAEINTAIINSELENGQVLTGQIVSKDKKRAVTLVNEVINMKEEYERQSRLSNSSIQEWNSLSKDKLIEEYGKFVVEDEQGNKRSLSAANVLMNERIAALEDYGKAERINKALAGKEHEVVKLYGELKDSIGDANSVGITAIDQVGDKFTNKTLKNVKDQAGIEVNRIKEENAKAIQRADYIKENK